MLNHPYGAEKKRRLAFLQKSGRQADGALGALFPELHLAKGKECYQQRVIAPFRIGYLRQGDQTEAVLAEASGVFADWEGDFAEEATVIEEMENREQAALFLAAHYYRHSMFVWFWAMYEEAQGSGHPYLFSQAADVCYFSGDPMERVRSVFEECLRRVEDPQQQQRLWNKLAVYHALRSDASEADMAVHVSMSLMKHVVSEEERVCRLAELHNTIALIHYQAGDHGAAAVALERAEECVRGFGQEHRRAARIRHILEANWKRLNLREQR